MTTTLRRGEIPPKARRPEPAASTLPTASRAASHRNSRRVYASRRASSSGLNNLFLPAAPLMNLEVSLIVLQTAPGFLLCTQIAGSRPLAGQSWPCAQHATSGKSQIAPVPAASRRYGHKSVQGDNAHRSYWDRI